MKSDRAESIIAGCLCFIRRYSTQTKSFMAIIKTGIILSQKRLLINVVGTISLLNYSPLDYFYNIISLTL